MTVERVSRADLEQIPAGTALLRQLRHYPAEAFADLTDDDLDLARRWLLAASYSALEGARAMERALSHRTEQDPTCSTSAPTETETNTTTDAPPRAVPPPADQPSESEPMRKAPRP